MTREELLEDVNVGDVIKIYTALNEVFVGKVVDFGPSGMKINLIDANKAKRIIYERITEYDLDENVDIQNVTDGYNESQVGEIEEPETHRILENTNSKGLIDVNGGREIKPVETENSMNFLDRKMLFDGIAIDTNIESIRQDFASMYSAGNKSELARIKDIIEYAKKISEYSLDSDRVRRAIAEYKKLANVDKKVNTYIALIYHEFGEYEKAAEYYHLAGEYSFEFQTIVNYNKEQNLFRIAILATKYNGENLIVIQWLCDYALRNKDISIIAFLLAYSEKLQGNILLYWYADQPEIVNLPNKEDLNCKENIQYLKNECLNVSVGNSAIQDIINEAESYTDIETIIDNKQENEITEGIISFYNKNGGNGMIKNFNGNQIYFYIKQVKDIELQRILATDSNYKRKVTYVRGINFKGQLAADAIYLNHDEARIESECAFEGFLEDYDVDKQFGKIRSDNELYNFRFDGIKDPLLYAEILSRPYSILELKVKFNVRNHKSKKTKKASKIAFDLVGEKIYSQEEIDNFLSQRLTTQKKVEDWLSLKASDGNVYFRETKYEPLQPVGAYFQEESLVEIKKQIEFRNDERKAISLIIPQGEKNPFLSLTKINEKKKFFQEAHRYMVGRKNANGDIIGVDLYKAEAFFIKAIQAGDQIESSVANLANVYIKFGNEYIVKGLQLLDVYGYLFPADKLTNLRIQLIDKSGNYEALELILLTAIGNCVKKNTIWQYKARLAGIYYKQQKWDLAIKCFNESLDYLDKNKNEFSQYITLRNGNLRSLIIANYSGGNRDKALLQAKDYLNRMPEDPVIKSIVNGTLGLEETKNAIDNFEDLKYEDDFFEVENVELSLFLSSKLQEVDLSSTFSKVPIVYEKLQSGVYTGNADDSNRAVKYINGNLLSKNKRGISAEYRSAISLGIARVISDSRENFNSSSDVKVALDEVKQHVARYARYSADVFVEKYSTVDSIRFLYIQALRYLGARDGGNIIASINMLIASFFVDSTKLPDELHEMKSSTYNHNYYKYDCLSVKDFLIATFMLQERQDYVTFILRKAYDEINLRAGMIERLNKMTETQKIVSDYYEFDALWKKGKGVYYKTIENLGKEISESINEYHMVGSIRQHIQRIKEALSLKVLWNQDEQILDSYLKLISLIGDTFEKYTVEEKIEGFRTAEDEIIKLKGDIEASPTEFSYDYVYTKLEELRFSIRERFDELYLSSSPECDISLSNNKVYVDENTVAIAITFRNSEDKQDADAAEIELKGSDGASFIRCEKKFTNIRSGEEQDYLAVFALENRVISEGQFDVTVMMRYRYRESVDNIKTGLISRILPVNIMDKENYISIENKYNRIFRGSGVDINTPELFKGRNALIDSICASMASGNGIMTKNRGIILWGQRRVGKNSVKDYLKEKIKEKYQSAYIIIELGSIGKSRNIREVLTTIINKTEDTLMTEYEDIYKKLIEHKMEFNGYALENTSDFMPEFSRFMDRFSLKLRKISENEKNIPLYFLDEFSYLYEWIEKGEMDGKEFMRFWKSFIQDYGICSIIIAQDNIPVWKSRYENEFACMNHDNEITYLDFDGAKELICEPCETEGKILFTPDAVKLIYDWTKGSAYLIVIFCKHVIDYLNDNYIEKATKTIVQLVFEKEFVEKKEMFKSDDFEPQIQDVANVGEEGEMINDLNKKLLKEIAGATVTSPQVKIEDLTFFRECDEEQARKVFNRLNDRKIIEVERDKYCSISMPLLKFYLLREQSLLNRDVLNKLSR